MIDRLTQQREGILAQLAAAPLAVPQTIAWRRVRLGSAQVVWWLGNTGYRVEQCGHPTALFPWMAYDPEGYMIFQPPRRKYAYQTAADARTVALNTYLEAATPAE